MHFVFWGQHPDTLFRRQDIGGSPWGYRIMLVTTEKLIEYLSNEN